MTTPSRRAAQKGRPGARPRRVPPRKSFWERNRSRLLLGAAAIALTLLGGQPVVSLFFAALGILLVRGLRDPSVAGWLDQA